MSNKFKIHCFHGKLRKKRKANQIQTTSNFAARAPNHPRNPAGADPRGDEEPADGAEGAGAERREERAVSGRAERRRADRRRRGGTRQACKGILAEYHYKTKL